MTVKTQTVVLRAKKGHLAALEYEESNPRYAVISTRPLGNGFLELTIVERTLPATRVEVAISYRGRGTSVFRVSPEEASALVGTAESEREENGITGIEVRTVREEEAK